MVHQCTPFDAVVNVEVYYLQNRLKSICVYIGNIAKLPYIDLVMLISNKIGRKEISVHIQILRYMELIGLRGVIHILTECENILRIEKGQSKSDVFF